MPDVHVQKIDVEQNQEFTQQYTIRSVPTIFLFKNGELVQNFVGLRTNEEYKQLVDELLG